MIRKIFGPSKIGGATLIISITSFLSYALGLLRDKTLAFHFGTTEATDAYNASFLIPDILFNFFIASALSAAFLPIFSEFLVKDKEEAKKIADTMLTGATLFIALIAIIVFILLPNIVPMLFQDASTTLQMDIIKMTRIMLASAVLFAISNTLGNILMSYRQFTSYALSAVLYNLGIILGIIFLHEKFGIYSAAIGVVIGALFHCLIRVIDIFTTDYRYTPRLAGNNPHIRKIIKLMIPRSLSLISWQFNLILFSIVGITLVEGGFSAFNYARNFQSFAVNLFGASLATAAFPYLSNALGKNDQKEYCNQVQQTTERILFFSIPAAVGMLMLSRPLVDMILGGGAFTETSAQMTSLILVFFALSIPFESLSHIFSRAFYALQDTMTPTKSNIICMAIMAFFTFFIAPKYGIEWFSIGFTIGFVVYCAMMIFALRKTLHGFNFKHFFLSFGKIIAASGVMALIIFWTKNLGEYMPETIATLTRVFIGAGSFFIIAFLLKSPEMAQMKSFIKNRNVAQQ